MDTLACSCAAASAELSSLYVPVSAGAGASVHTRPDERVLATSAPRKCLQQVGGAGDVDGGVADGRGGGDMGRGCGRRGGDGRAMRERLEKEASREKGVGGKLAKEG
jgi:hypothetical protein